MTPHRTKYYNNNFNAEIENYLQNPKRNKMISSVDFNAKFEERLGLLNEKIKELGLVISGSFVISTLLDVWKESEYSSSDIDISVGYSIEGSTQLAINSDFDRWIVSELGGLLILNSRYQTKSWKYICPHFTLNIINTGRTTSKEIVKYIEETSDLSICMSTYDGYRTRFFPSLFDRQAIVTNSHLLFSTFHFDGSVVDEEDAFKKFKSIFLLKRKTRQVKYINRGFKIAGVSITDFDRFNANEFSIEADNKERSIRESIKFVVSLISEDDTLTLNDVLKGNFLFRYKHEVPILSIHSSLTIEEYPWVAKWL